MDNEDEQVLKKECKPGINGPFDVDRHHSALMLGGASAFTGGGSWGRVHLKSEMCSLELRQPHKQHKFTYQYYTKAHRDYDSNGF